MASKGRGVLIATESGTGTLRDGTEVTFHKGVTRVREGHPVAEQWPQFFKPIEVHYDLEDATDEPGRKRGER